MTSGHAAAELELVIDPDTVARFGEVEVAAVAARGLAVVRDGLGASVARVVEEATAAVRDRFAAPEEVARDERIDAWRQAIRACGLSASDVRSSPEQLVRRVLRDGDLPGDDPLVRAYCALSAKHVAPLGAYDADRLPARTIALRPARPTDSFEPLGGPGREMALEPRVIVYAAGDEVVCWAFNHRDSARTALLQETDRAVFIGEAVFPAHRPALAAAVAELRDVLARHGAIIGETAVAAAGTPRVTLASP